MTHIDPASTEPDRPLAPKPTSIRVAVFVDGRPAGELEGERATDFEARELATQILREVEALLQGSTYAH